MTATTHLERINRHAKSGYWSLIFWLPLLAISGMGFDAPTSQSALLPWFFVGVVILIPMLVVVGPRIAREMLKKGRVKTAYAIIIGPQVLIFTPMLMALVVAILGFWKL